MFEENVPLVPESTMRYFKDSSQLSYPTYMRVVGIRNCLENIVNTIFIYLTNRKSKEKWIRNTTLSEKINLTKDYFPDEIFTKIDNLRILGNTVHPDTEEHKNLTHQDINLALEDISKICEWIIITYLKKNGFQTNSWIPTMLSTLPPIYRVTILEELYKYYTLNYNPNSLTILEYLDVIQNNDHLCMTRQISYKEYQDYTPFPNENKLSQILLVIEKLAMAYLKNGFYNKSIEFIQLQFDNKMINLLFKEQMLDKLLSLEKERSNLPISKNLKETKKHFKEILSVVKEDEYSLFITLFTAIVAQDELETIGLPR